MLSTYSSSSMLGIFLIGKGLASSAALDARGIPSSRQTHRCSNKVQDGQYKGCSLLRIYLKTDSAIQYKEKCFTLKKFNPHWEREQPAVVTNIKISSSAAPIAPTALHISGTSLPTLGCFGADLSPVPAWVCSFGPCRPHPLCQLVPELVFLPCNCSQCYLSIASSPKQRR